MTNVWCYDCDARWRVPVAALYGRLARCPDCGGYTDGVEDRSS